MRRLVIFVGALLVALLAAEGALSLLAGRTLRELWAGRPAPTWRASDVPRPSAATDAAGAADAAGAPRAADDGGTDPLLGDIYAAHEDPRVGYVLKPESDLSIYDGQIRSDRLGMRSRPGPEPPPDALRIVVLGDSVAFGFGVDDDQTLAHRLEVHLAELRGPGERPIVCRTVAIPSWNQRAAGAFLLDHWDELRPDIVLALPIGNDVCDIDSVLPSGSRRPAPDPSSPDPWLTVSVRLMVSAVVDGFQAGRGGQIEVSQLGSDAAFGDLCAESRRRHDENADSIVRLQARLAERGCRLGLVWNVLSDYTWFLGSRLAERAPELQAFTLLRWGRSEFSLGHDRHSNALTLDVCARWLALDLVERGWVSRGEGRPLEPAPETYAELRVPELPSPDECRRLADEAHARFAALLTDAIDFRTGLGVKQVFGGLNKDFTARSRLLAILRPEGEVLALELAPIAERPDLYPLEVAVEIGGRPAGRVVVEATAVATARLPLPAGIDRDQPLEVRLSPERWIVRAGSGEAARRLPPESVPMDLVSFRPLRMACETQ